MRVDSSSFQIRAYIRDYLLRRNYPVMGVRILSRSENDCYACAYLSDYRGKVYVRIAREEGEFVIKSLEVV